MNRRNFFKVVTGFVAGVCTAFVPKAKANLNNLKLLPSSVRKRSGRDEIVNKFLLSSDTHLIFREKMEQFRIEAAFKAANPPLVFNPTDNWQLDRGKWRHVVITNENNDKPIVVYLDGKLVV